MNPRQKIAIFYIPHQDDEILQMGVGIVNHIHLGFEVHVVLCTRGNNSWARNFFSESYSGSSYPHHGIVLNEDEFVAARNREFIWSCNCLGVDKNNIHFEEYDDGTLSVEESKSIVLKFEDKFPNACHKTMSYTDPHSDHANLGEALDQLFNEKRVSDARFYIEIFQNEKEAKGFLEESRKTYLPFLKAANHVYRSFIPDKGLFSIGYHSVPDRFEKNLKHPHSKYHLPGVNR